MEVDIPQGAKYKIKVSAVFGYKITEKESLKIGLDNEPYSNELCGWPLV